MPHPAEPRRAQIPQVLLVSYDGETDHFVGVEAALAARGVRGARYTQKDAADGFPASARVVVVKESRSYLSLFALRQARRIGATCILVMDGIVEHRNTYLNPRAGPDFLRPAPVDVIACAGEVDRRLLEGFGNHAVATGLPRLAAGFSRPLPPPDSKAILVATANQPAFSDRERARLLRSLIRLKTTLAGMGVPVIWRLTGGLDVELGVVRDPAAPQTSLREALAGVAAVITTPSTVLVESMLAGRPTALLHPHATPCWQPAVWVWRGGEVPEGELGAGLHPESIAVATAAELVQRLLALSDAEIDRHCAAAAAMHEGSRPASDALTDLIVGQLRHPRRARHPVAVPSVERLPALLPAPTPTRPRVVACIRLDGTTVGDHLVRAQRLAAALAEREGGGYDLHILALITQPDAWDPHASTLCADGRTHACVIDPLAEPWTIIDTARRALERLGPSIVLAQAEELCLLAAEHARATGARVVPIVDGDGEGVRSLLAHFDRWDGAAVGDGASLAWLGDAAADRPVDVVPPIVHIPGVLPREVPDAPLAPLRLAYIGPMLEPGCRIHTMQSLLDALEAAAVPHELHLVGDGDHLAAWLVLARATPRRWGRITSHGRQDDAWVRAFLATIDVSLHPGEGRHAGSTGVLDAMAAGAVPVIAADTAAAFAGLLRDGDNAILAPDASVAARLVELARDRERLAAMSRAAHRAALALPSAEAATRAAAELFDRVLARPASPAPSDRGVRLHAGGCWQREWSEDPAAAEAWIRDRLAAAGFHDVALDRPTPGCDAVIVRPHHQRLRPCDLAEWRSRGVAVVVSPRLRADFPPLVLRLYALLDAAVAEGAKRIAIYGTGAHTRRAKALLELDAPIVGFLDDAPPESGELWGLPVVSLADAAARLSPDAVLLSSDAWEPQMWAQCAPLRASGVRVIPVYGRYEERPAPPAAASAGPLAPLTQHPTQHATEALIP